jgi:hypothetical protein
MNLESINQGNNPEENKDGIPIEPDKDLGSINIDRNIALEAGIEFNPDYFYRMIGEAGFSDFLESGIVRSAKDTKQAYEKSYYFKGHPLKRYSRGKTDYFIEVKPIENLFSESDANYPHSTREITKEDEVRVYKYTKGIGSELVFDNFKS